MRLYVVCGLVTLCFVSLSFSAGGGRGTPPSRGSPTAIASTPWKQNTWTEGTMTFRKITDAKYVLVLSTTREGQITLVATDTKGTPIYNGPFTTDADRSKVAQPLIRAIRLDNVRAQMEVLSEDEWTVIAPRLSKVIDLQEQLQADLACDPLGLRLDAAPQAPDALATSMASLGDKTAGNVADADVKASLADFRNARDKMRKDLADAQKEIWKVSSFRQEAVLARMGILE